MSYEYIEDYIYQKSKGIKSTFEDNQYFDPEHGYPVSVSPVSLAQSSSLEGSVVESPNEEDMVMGADNQEEKNGRVKRDLGKDVIIRLAISIEESYT